MIHASTDTLPTIIQREGQLPWMVPPRNGWTRGLWVQQVPGYLKAPYLAGHTQIEPLLRRDGFYLVRGNKKQGQRDFVWYEYDGKAYYMPNASMAMHEPKFLRDTERKAWEVLANVGDCATRVLALKKLRDHEVSVYPFKCRLRVYKIKKRMKNDIRQNT